MSEIQSDMWNKVVLTDLLTLRHGYQFRTNDFHSFFFPYRGVDAIRTSKRDHYQLLFCFVFDWSYFGCIIGHCTFLYPGITMVFAEQRKIYAYPILQYIIRMAINSDFHFNCFYDFRRCCSNDTKKF